HAQRLIARLAPAVVHAHDLFSTTTTGIIARARSGMAVVVTSHGGGYPGDVQRLQRKLFGRARMKLFRRTVDAFVCISSEIDQELANVGVPDARRCFLPNGVDHARFHPCRKVAKDGLRVRLGLPEGPMAVYCGRLFVGKRVIDLVEVWPRVRQACPQAKLVIVGDGPEERRLRMAAGEGVTFTGAVDNVAPYLQAADVFCLPSSHEGLSISLLEAMSCGLATVVTDVGGARDCLQHGVSGWVITPGDREALYNGILRFLSDDASREAMGRAARERVHTDYSLSVMATRLAGLYAHVCRTRAQGAWPLRYTVDKGVA
ncbi:MAG: glycosyltransferase, partial [Chitinivibrionales bacterium]|nr:glycosyltransferase [Chitinivibrionales bacterium]